MHRTSISMASVESVASPTRPSYIRRWEASTPLAAHWSDLSTNTMANILLQRMNQAPTTKTPLQTARKGPLSRTVSDVVEVEPGRHRGLDFCYGDAIIDPFAADLCPRDEASVSIHNWQTGQYWIVEGNPRERRSRKGQRWSYQTNSCAGRIVLFKSVKKLRSHIS